MIYRGTVRKVNDNGTVNVDVPRVREGFTFTNCLVNVPATPLLDDAADSHGATGSALHVTPITRHTLVVGERVLCAYLEGNPDALVVLGRLSG